jgi:hypothetical protein
VEYFLGYHGTSEASAKNILATGVRAEALPPRGQIGPGFYIARTNRALPEWGGVQATAVARARLPWYMKIMVSLTGYDWNPLVPDDTIITILKVYSTVPLTKLKWSIMNPPSIPWMRAIIQQEGDWDWAESAKWLQMVIPFADLPHLVVKRDDGIFENPTGWWSHESPI